VLQYIHNLEDSAHVRIMKMSAGVDMSMAVSTTGDVYGWGKTDRGRCGLGLQNGYVMLPQRVPLSTSTTTTSSSSSSTDGTSSQPLKAIDVDCGYVHSLVVGLNGTIHMCGAVGINGALDGGDTAHGTPVPMEDFNIWHRIPEPKEQVVTQAYKKYGKYEIKGKNKMMTEPI
jgi:alpha-tubulin suppressor-like RCC1 family protein